MKLLRLILAGALLVSCSSSPPNSRRVVTVSEAVDRDPEDGLQSGVYKKGSTNENLWLTVTNLRQQVGDLQREQVEKQKLLRHLQKSNEEALSKNDQLRIRLNTGIEDEVSSDDTPTAPIKHKGPKATGFRDNSQHTPEVEYRDEFRLSNETSAQPGHGVKELGAKPVRDPASLPEPVNHEEVQ